MNKKQYVISFFLLGFTSIFAQDSLDKVKLRIHYVYQEKKWEEKNSIAKDEKILDVGSVSSHFYSLWEERIRDVRDSVISLGGNLQDVLKAIDMTGYPHSYSYYNVLKNYPHKGRLTYTDKIFKNFIYEEELTFPKWEMLQQDTVMAGYSCQKAQTTFRGRTWHVWYTLDIPISDGPWKLCGLPGLILKAEDSKRDFIFECIEIEEGRQQPISLRKAKYIRCTSETLEENYRLEAKDPNLYMNKFGMKTGAAYDANGRLLIYKPRTPVLLEYRLEDIK